MKSLTTFAAVLFSCELVSFGVENRYLACDHPYFAFDVNEIGYSPLDAMYIYDATNAEGKSMRINGGTSAFGAAKVSRIAETQIVAGHFTRGELIKMHSAVHAGIDYLGKTFLFARPVIH
mgnify:CR=1 FL=1